LTVWNVAHEPAGAVAAAERVLAELSMVAQVDPGLDKKKDPGAAALNGMFFPVTVNLGGSGKPDVGAKIKFEESGTVSIAQCGLVTTFDGNTPICSRITHWSAVLPLSIHHSTPFRKLVL